MAKPDVITLTGLRAFGYHGVFDFERREGQEFIVDLVVGLDMRPAAHSDDVADTVDYGALAIKPDDLALDQLEDSGGQSDHFVTSGIPFPFKSTVRIPF